MGISWSGLFWKVVIWKTPFCKSPHKFYSKDKNPKNNWVGHSLMKPMDVDELLNIRVIISELEARLNDDDEIDASGITESQIEIVVVAELAQQEYIPMGGVGEEFEATVVTEKELKNKVWILKQILKILEQWVNL